MKAFIIAAPQSGSGKTTITIGIMEVLRRRGLTVAPFKVGPDFIDPGYHRSVTRRPSINLDGWMCGVGGVRDSFARYSDGVDVAVIEGVMGLFDGYGGKSEEGSSAQVAKLLDLPVFLVVDARGQARSVAAMIRGFLDFDPDLRLAGIIFNQVSSESHARILRDAVSELEYPPPVLGCVPADSRVAIPSRHLGLITADENPLPPTYLEYLAAVVRENIDLALLWSLALSWYHPDETPQAEPADPQMPALKIAVARDEAFCFVYEDNLRLLSEAGAELIPFSPINDSESPEGVCGIYLPGGYPELYMEQLSGNDSMKASISTSISSGMPVYAECGGFIYLTKGVISYEGPPESIYPFVGIFPVNTRMLPRRRALGYREVELTADTPIGKSGTKARGHEFHYSEIFEMPVGVERSYRVHRGSTELGSEGYRVGNCIASYIHLHFGSCPDIAVNFVESCRLWMKRSG